MSDLVFRPRGLYYEEIEVGKNLVTAGRTITESDIVSFAGISGDFNQMHVDAEYAKAGEFGQRVAHGLLVVSVTTGLIVQTGLMEGTVLARLGGGSVTAKIRVYDQHDQVVQRGTMVLLVRSKPD